MKDSFVSKKIMIVEDNLVNQKVMGKLVKIFGHESIIIEDGFQAIEQIKLQKPDLILMDIQLVGITGIEITQDLKKDDILKKIPVIAVTASASEHDKKRIIEESGCDDYLAKPFSIDDLRNKIAKFVEIKQA
jgi:two-component system, cell cycle response regulator DivK